MGIDESKRSSGITGAAYRYDPGRDAWEMISPVPGTPRLGATAQSVEGKIYLFGGFTVDRRLRETTVATVDIYDPLRNSYSSAAHLPIAVDDAVSGVWRDRLIFLVSGWSGEGNVKNVQFYDPRLDRWSQATPIPGPPVFGHAGGIVGDSIVYCDGVKIDLAGDERFVLSPLCFHGEIDPSDPMRINWSEIPHHPGGAKYRMAAGVLSTAGKIAFAGGSSNPYNYSAVGYDGIPSAPSSAAFLFDPKQSRWERAGRNILPTMDHRGLAGGGDTLTLIGGITSRGRVTSRVEKLFTPR
jgi:N-acetylneuraminic acid mutarotase